MRPSCHDMGETGEAFRETTAGSLTILPASPISIGKARPIADPA